MSYPNTFWEKIWASGSFIKSLFLDDVVSTLMVDTPLGSGFLEVQARKTGERYIVLKMKGGNATVWVPLGQTAATQLVEFIQSSLAERPRQ